MFIFMHNLHNYKYIFFFPYFLLEQWHQQVAKKNFLNNSKQLSRVLNVIRQR